MPLALGLDPDAAAMDLDDALDDGEADAGALGTGLQTLEEAEDLLLELGIDADAVVAHVEDPGAGVLPAADLDSGLGLVAHELDRVLHQVMHHLEEPRAIVVDCRQVGGDLHLDVPLHDP